MPLFRRSRRALVARLRRLRSERGSTLPFLVVLMPAFVGFVGLAYDGGQLFVARREALNVASAAARAGANDVNIDTLYLGFPILNTSAPGTARAFALASGADTANARLVTPTQVEVTTTETVTKTFMGLFGVNSLTITAEATAEMQDCCET